MFAELLPGWWTNSAACLWLSGPGAPFVAWGLHTLSLVGELGMFARLIDVDPRRRTAYQALRIAWLATHMVVVFGTIFLLDGGATFHNMSGDWALLVAGAAVIVLAGARIHEAGTKRRRLKSANLKSNDPPKGRYES